MHGDGSDAVVADAVVDEIRSAGGTAEPSYDSVDTAEGGAAIVRTAIDQYGRLDAVVSNAGIFQTTPFAELSPQEWRRMLGVHLDGAFHVSQPAFRVMQSQGSGRFVFIASSAGLFGQPEAAHYAAAKAGTLGLANVIAIEGAPHGILANCVLPFGYSRMVAESVGEFAELPEVQMFVRAIDP
jgi:NAD(P)-dependent dehydrogenase (short-subunit alcohol dehydrogenase family)